MKSLILVAHGSRREASNEEVRRLTDGLASKAGRSFDRVTCAFLELADPSIPDGIEHEVRGGADEVVVLPYFLSAGRHVAEDIPGLVEAKRRQYPDVRIRVADYLGASPAVTDLLLSIANDTAA